MQSIDIEAEPAAAAELAGERIEALREFARDLGERLGLGNVEIKRGRAEEFHGAFEADQATARAVTALRKLVPLAAPLLRDGGELLLLKGSGVDAEIDAAEKVLRKHRVHDIAVEELGTGLLAETTRVFRARVR